MREAKKTTAIIHSTGLPEKVTVFKHCGQWFAYYKGKYYPAIHNPINGEYCVYDAFGALEHFVMLFKEGA